MAPIAGKLSDIYGKKKILVIIMSIFVASIALAGFSFNASSLIVLRIIQGVGLSMFIVSLSILQSEVQKEKYALANGILASLYFSGSSIGLVLGGSIVHYTNWRIDFFSLAPLLAILYLITIKFLKVRETKQSIDQNVSGIPYSLSDNFNRQNKELYSPIPNKDHYRLNKSKPKRIDLDIKGAILLGTSITFLLLTLSYLAEGNSPDSNNLGLTKSSFELPLIFLLIFVISVITFIKTEQKTVNPLLNIKFIASWNIFPLLIVFLIMGLTMFMIYQTIPILVKAPMPTGFGGNALESSVVLLPFTIVFLIMSLVVSKIISKFGNLKPLIVASLISLIGFVGIFVFHSDEIQIGLNLTVIATGLAMLNTIAMNVILLIIPKQYGGVIVGIVQVFTFTGMALGPIISGLYMQSYHISIEHKIQVLISLPSREAYQLIFLTSAIASSISLAMAFILNRKIPSKIIKT